MPGVPTTKQRNYTNPKTLNKKQKRERQYI